MPGALTPFILADFVLPGAGQWLAFLSPLVVIATACWLVSRTERIVHYVFPYLEWEHSLGSFNIKAEKRANLAMRWVKFGIYVMLFDSLFGIAWGAQGLSMLGNWSDPWVMGELALRMPALGFCLIIWVLYIGAYLIPRVRAERDRVAWLKMRAENQAEEEARRERGVPEQPKSRIHTPPRKPRTNTPHGLPKKPALTAQQRARRSHGPGG